MAQGFSSLPVSPLMQPMPEPFTIKGVRMASTEAGIRRKGEKDLMFAEFSPMTQVAGVFTRSRCPGAPIDWCRAQLPHHIARALIVNSGNANVFTGDVGRRACEQTALEASHIGHYPQESVYIASTGVIGEFLPVERITASLGDLHNDLREDGWRDAAHAIMTTDTFPKLAQRTTQLMGKDVKIQGIAKGSGMVAPDMATMLAFVATDADIPGPQLQTLLRAGIDKSFNCITVDSDTSTSDMVLLFATGQAQHAKIDSTRNPLTNIQLKEFRQALFDVLRDLALLVIRDGEGAQKLITIRVTGASNDASARRIGLSIGNSPLVKTAVAGEDPNWGRIVMAVGKAGEPAQRDTLSIKIGGHLIAKAGRAVENYDETPVLNHMKGREVDIDIDLGLNDGKATVWGCDLTHAYVDINGDYRS